MKYKKHVLHGALKDFFALPLMAVERRRRLQRVSMYTDAGILVDADVSAVVSCFEHEEELYALYPDLVCSGDATAPEAPMLELCKTCEDGFYASKPNPVSLLCGEDYGNLLHPTIRPWLPELTMVERLALADVRTYQVVVKIVAPHLRQDGMHSKMTGHAISFLQSVQGELGSDAQSISDRLEAAVTSIEVFFVGPSNTEDHMLRQASGLKDLHARAYVLHNYLMLRQTLHFARPWASTETFAEANSSAASVQNRLLSRRRHVTDTRVEDAVESASDVAGIRNANDGAGAGGGGLSKGDSSDQAAPDPLLLTHVALVSAGAGAGAHAMLDAIAEKLELSRSTDPVNEFTHNDQLLTAAFWHLFPGRSPFRDRGTVGAKTRTRLFTFYDGRFQRDHNLVFLLANQIQRHACACSVKAHIGSAPGAYAAFEEASCDEGVQELLDAAKQDPDGKESRELQRRVLPFLNLCGKRVPWSSMERKACLSDLYALSRRYGSPSVFWTVAPDDVHHPTSLRLSARFRSNDTFPAAPEEFLERIRRGEVVESELLGKADIDVEVPLRESTLQALAAQNPVATSLTFHLLVQSVFKVLLGVDLSGKKSRLPAERASGLFGRPLSAYAVTEENGRGALHVHGLFWGGAAPGLIAGAQVCVQSDVCFTVLASSDGLAAAHRCRSGCRPG